MSEPITVPPAAAQRIVAIVNRRAAVEQELNAAVELLRAALGAPDDWQLQKLATGALEFFDGFGRPPAGLADDVERPAGVAPSPQERRRVELVKRHELDARDMGGGVFRRRADVEQIGRGALRQTALQFPHRDAVFIMDRVIIHVMII